MVADGIDISQDNSVTKSRILGGGGELIIKGILSFLELLMIIQPGKLLRWFGF